MRLRGRIGEKLMYKLTCAYDGKAPHWTAEYEIEFGAWESFFRFTDWGMANEFSTVNIMTPTGKMYTKVFYRNGMVSVK
jgi:hypothetical protein